MLVDSRFGISREDLQVPGWGLLFAADNTAASSGRDSWPSEEACVVRFVLRSAAVGSFFFLPWVSAAAEWGSRVFGPGLVVGCGRLDTSKHTFQLALLEPGVIFAYGVWHGRHSVLRGGQWEQPRRRRYRSA
jgi:hypothetical protein